MKFPMSAHAYLSRGGDSAAHGVQPVNGNGIQRTQTLLSTPLTVHLYIGNKNCNLLLLGLVSLLFFCRFVYTAQPTTTSELNQAI